MNLNHLLPAPLPPHAQVAHLPLTPVRALCYLAAGCALTALTHRTNPGPLSLVGGIVSLGLLLLAAHRHGPPAITAIDTTPHHAWGPWLRTGTATLAWAALLLIAATTAELAVRHLTDETAPLPDTGPTTLLPALVPTLAILTCTLLNGAQWRPGEMYTVAASLAVLTTLAAQGWDATPGALPAAAATVALAWLFRRTHRGVPVLLAGGVAALALALTLPN